MNYEAWRITYQSSEQAARAAFEMLLDLGGDIGFRARLIGRIKSERDALRTELEIVRAQRNASNRETERLRDELDALKRQEPIAYKHRDGMLSKRLPGGPVLGIDWVPLYAAPVPQAPSVPERLRATLTKIDETLARAYRTCPIEREAEIIQARADIAAMLAAATQPECWKPTEQDRAAIRAALDQRAPIAELPTGSVAFLSYGDEPDYSQLDCPACGGSGHVGDTRAGAVLDVLTERRRQIEVEGWTPEHDDEHKEGEMAVAAGYYALQCGYPHERESSVPTYWPWDAKWWKPRDKRRNMIKSVALGLAEIERMDRAALSAGDERGAS